MDNFVLWLMAVGFFGFAVLIANGLLVEGLNQLDQRMRIRRAMWVADFHRFFQWPIRVWLWGVDGAWLIQRPMGSYSQILHQFSSGQPWTAHVFYGLEQAAVWPLKVWGLHPGPTGAFFSAGAVMRWGTLWLRYDVAWLVPLAVWAGFWYGWARLESALTPPAPPEDATPRETAVFHARRRRTPGVIVLAAYRARRDRRDRQTQEREGP